MAEPDERQTEEASASAPRPPDRLAALRAWPLRRWRGLAIVAALTALYALAGFFLLPVLAKSWAEDLVAQQPGLKLALGRIRFNPFTLTALIEDFALSGADDAPLVSFDALLVNAQLSSLWHRGAVLREVDLAGLQVNVVVQPDGSLNLAALAPSAGSSEEPSTVPTVHVGTLSLRDGRLTLEDRSRPRPFAATLTPIEFTLTDFRTEPGFDNKYHFAAASLENERLDWSGQFTVQPLGSSGSFTISTLKASTVTAYLQDDLPFALPSGLIDLQGRYRLALQDELQLEVQLPSIRLSELDVALASDTGAPWIRVPTLEVLDTALSLPKRELVVDRVRSSGITLDVWREPDGSINLQRLFSGEAEAVSSPPVDAPIASNSPAEPAGQAPWQIKVNAVEVDAATVNAEDRAVAPAVRMTLAPVRLNVTNYSNATDSKLGLEATVGVGEGQLGMQGQIQLQPLTTDLAVKLTDFDLVPLQPYVAQNTSMTVNSGRLSTDSRVAFRAEPRGQPQLEFAGNVELADLVTKDNAQNQDFLKWTLLRLSDLRYQMAPDRLTIERILARKPYARVLIAEDGSVNVSQVLTPPGAPKVAEAEPAADTGKAAAAAPSSAKPMPIRIGTVAVEDGTANFADYSIEPSFAAGILGLKGTVTGLSSERDSRAKVKLEGSVERYAPVSISGEVNLLSAAIFSDIQMSFRNMELTTFNPYSGKFAGYNIAKGKLTTELHYKVDNRALDAQHHIVIDQLEFGGATGSKDAVPLPIKLAVSLLKDRNGVIDLDVPVTGSLDDPQFRLGPIIWKVVVNLLTRIVTAPFALLGSLFGGGEDLAFVDFAPGSAGLAPEQADKLVKLSNALVERPQLKLDIPLTVTTSDDDTALTQRALDELLAGVPPGKPADDPVAQGRQRLNALLSVYGKQLGGQPAYPAPADPAADATPVQIEFLEKELLAHLAGAIQAQKEGLARSRADAVQGALLANTGVAPERVFLTSRASEAESPQGTVRMELKLE